MRRSAAILAAAALLLAAAGCRDERKPLSEGERERILGKADSRIVRMIEAGDPEKAAAVAIFEGDAFLGYAQSLQESGIPILNEFGPAALVLASGPELRALASLPQVRRIAYFSRHQRLGRLDPVLELSLLKRMGEGKENDPLSVNVLFGAPFGEKERKALADAGFAVGTAGGTSLAATGPALAVPRLLEIDGIMYVESASK